MSKGSRVREVLEKYFSWTTYGYGAQVDTKKQIELALSDLAEIVRGEKKCREIKYKEGCDKCHIKGLCPDVFKGKIIDDIAKLFEAKD